MFWVLCALLLFLLYLLYSPMQSAYFDIKTEAHERQLLMNDPVFIESMRRRRYAPLHTLPRITFNASFDTLEASYGGHCFTTPTRVTSEDVPQYNCVAVCDDNRAAYFYVSSFDNFIVNGIRLREGGYCTTNSIPRNCNRETSVLIHSINHWTCIPEDPRFYAGNNNLVPVAGRQHSTMMLPSDINKNVLYDRLLNRPVNPTVNNFRRSWDEELPQGGRRFVVYCNGLDMKHNLMFNNPLNPIECLPNVCTNVNYVHRSVIPNFEKGECDCGDVNETRVANIDYRDKSSKCASVVDRLYINDKYCTFRIDCLALDTPVADFRTDILLCPPDIFNSNTDFAYEFVLEGVVPMSGNGIREPTYRLWNDTRTRIVWRDINQH
ncbi:pif-2 [Spodoptera litura granulovirus]|uniref:Pif-2 n=1 Tax=Spodoptera litura granulovirus TaxID=359919 RepID=A5IZP1_9BBAC|nr:pif-2 [Spodoptera litura granulovirus]ABQ51982.1 pif-2 [Spodoptera litura granulovirus]